MDFSYSTGLPQVYPIEIARLNKAVTFKGKIPSGYKLSGSFIFSVLTPTMSMNQEEKEVYRPRSAKTQSKNVKATSSKMTNTNTLMLPIPLHLALNFVTSMTMSTTSKLPTVTISIPANTEFIASFIGGDPNEVRLVGINDTVIYTTEEEFNE